MSVGDSDFNKEGKEQKFSHSCLEIISDGGTLLPGFD